MFLTLVLGALKRLIEAADYVYSNVAGHYSHLPFVHG